MKRIEIPINDTRTAILTVASCQQLLERMKEIALQTHSHLLACQELSVAKENLLMQNADENDETVCSDD